MRRATDRRYEQLLSCYLSLLCREVFIRNFFTRTFIMDDLLKKIRELILDYESDPNNITRIRLMLNDGSKDVILLVEILSYLKESLTVIDLPSRPVNDPTGERLFDLLHVERQLHDVVLRTNDLQKLVNGAQVGAAQPSPAQRSAHVVLCASGGGWMQFWTPAPARAGDGGTRGGGSLTNCAGLHVVSFVCLARP